MVGPNDLSSTFEKPVKKSEEENMEMTNNEKYEKLHCGRKFTTRACLYDEDFFDEWKESDSEDDTPGEKSLSEYNFKMKTCNHFIPQEGKTELCLCNTTKDNHSRDDPNFVEEQKAPPGLKWNSKKDAKEIPTNGVGSVKVVSDVCFGGIKKIQKYVRLSDETKEEDLYVFMKEYWKVPDPNIIISVTGGAQDFNLDSELSFQFRRGLVKSARDTGAWITTGGTDTGVMKIVGNAIREQPQSIASKLVLIGFATWGIVKGRDSLKGENAEYFITKGVPFEFAALNPDHTHFILVDDGSQGAFGKEIEFRSNFEKFVSLEVGKDTADSVVSSKSNSPIGTPHKTSIHSMQSSSCKLVTVLLEGGPNSAETVYKSLERKVPVVIAEHSGRASDIISFAKRNAKIVTDRKTNVKKVVFDDDVVGVLERDMCNFYNWTTEKNRDDLDKQLNYLRLICSEENRQFVTIFSIKDPYNNDLDKAILGALIKGMQVEAGDYKDSKAEIQKNLKDQLLFSVKWNRPDTAAKHIFNKKRVFEEGFLEKLFLECMLDNKYEFVKVLLQNGINLQTQFKRIHTLEQLFVYKNSFNRPLKSFLEEHACGREEIENPFMLAILRGIEELIGGGFELSLCNIDWDEGKEKMPSEFQEAQIFVEHYKEYYKEKKELEDEGRRYLSDADILAMNNPPPEVKDPCFILFLWALIMNYHDLAKIIGRFGDNYMAKALIAMRVYQKRAYHGKLDLDDLNENFVDFSNISMELLQKCYKVNESDTSLMIVSRLSICSSHSVLGLAALANHGDFVAHDGAQTILDEIWAGCIKQTRQLLFKVYCCFFLPCPALAPILAPIFALYWFEYDHLGNIFADQVSKDTETNSIGSKDYAKRETSRRVESMDNKYGVYKKLCMFFTAPVTKFVSTTLFFVVFLTVYAQFVLGELPPRDSTPWIEIGLAIFVLSVTTEEIRQIWTESGKWSKKLKQYFSTVWNWFDAIGIVLFWVAFGLSVSTHDENLRNWARLFYIADVFLWYMRLLHIFAVDRDLGTIVTIILQMILRAWRFLSVWMLFMVAFGTITKAITVPKRYGDVTIWDLFFVYDQSYWQTFGELFIDDIIDPDNDSCTKDYYDDSGLDPCPFHPEFSLFVIASYMVIGNILLMNLLIAMFSSVYEQIRGNAGVDWKNKRLGLIAEYHMKPFLPPPLTILQHCVLLFRAKEHRMDVKNSRGLIQKIGISNERKIQLMLFEEEQKEEYLLNQSSKDNLDISQQIRNLNKKLDQHIQDVHQLLTNIEKQQ